MSQSLFYCYHVQAILNNVRNRILFLSRANGMWASGMPRGMALLYILSNYFC